MPTVTDWRRWSVLQRRFWFCSSRHTSRWQMELTFKRLKSILNLDELPAKNAALAQVILFAKLLGALLVDDYTERYVSFFPWGYPIAIDDAPAFSLAHR